MLAGASVFVAVAFEFRWVRESLITRKFGDIGIRPKVHLSLRSGQGS